MFSGRKYGNTCPYCNIELEKNQKNEKILIEDADKTLIAAGMEEEIEPVTGWLVCIEGPRCGKDYKIRTGKNFIGRADNMQIQILGDNAVARVNHAAVVYDKKNNSTFLLPGDSTGLVYHNEDAVYAPVELAPYSIIELGNSKFLFIPLCGEHFKWGNQTK